MKMGELDDNRAGSPSAVIANIPSHTGPVQEQSRLTASCPCHSRGYIAIELGGRVDLPSGGQSARAIDLEDETSIG